MNRRTALHALGVGGAAFLMPYRVWSQKPPPVVAVPLIAAGPDDPIIIELRKGLAEYAYIDGKNIQILYRSSGGTVERLPSLLRELVRLKVDIIAAGAAPSWQPRGMRRAPSLSSWWDGTMIPWRLASWIA